MNALPRQLIWTLCLLLVLSLHGGMAAWALYWQVETPPQELPPAAMLVELAPLPPAVAAPPPPPPPPQVEPEAPKPLPKLAEAPKPALALPPPKPRPKPQPPQPKPQPPKPVEPTPAPPQPQAPPPAEAAPAPAPAEQPVVTPPTPSNDTSEEAIWSAKMHAYLRKRVKYPDAARRTERAGSIRYVTLRFVVNAEGEVTDYSIAKTSGSAVFDRAALQLIRRAGTLPAPPATALTNGSRDVNFPISYQLEER